MRGESGEAEAGCGAARPLPVHACNICQRACMCVSRYACNVCVKICNSVRVYARYSQ
jgi:hypothetical protein